MTLDIDPKGIFPWVTPTSRMGSLALPRIAAYANNLDLAPLNPNHTRFFLQPWGIVAWAVGLDLATETVTRYPGAREKGAVYTRTADPEVFAKLKLRLNSETFRTLPAETKKWGCDGASYFIETHISGTYSWKCHWLPNDKIFIEIADLFQALSQKPVGP
jgi:hypothetical protein